MGEHGQRPTAVLDAMVYLQALASPAGTSAVCLELWDAGRFRLCLSRAILLEVGDVLMRPAIRSRFPRLNDELIYTFMQRLRAVADYVDQPIHAVSLPRDPGDEPYLDLAVAAKTDFLVSWNERHLGYLMAGNTRESVELRRVHPSLRIVTPPEFLRSVRDATSENSP